MKAHNLTTAIRRSLAAARDAEGDTSTYSKQLKVRFLEGYNSRDVLDFDLYLVPATYLAMEHIFGESSTRQELAHRHAYGDPSQLVYFIKNPFRCPSVAFLEGYTAEEVANYNYYADRANFPHNIDAAEFVVSIPPSRRRSRPAFPGEPHECNDQPHTAGAPAQ